MPVLLDPLYGWKHLKCYSYTIQYLNLAIYILSSLVSPHNAVVYLTSYPLFFSRCNSLNN